MAKKTTTKKKAAPKAAPKPPNEILDCVKEIAKGDTSSIWVRAAVETIRRHENQKDKDALSNFVKEFRNAFKQDKKSMILAVGGDNTKKLNNFKL